MRGVAVGLKVELGLKQFLRAKAQTSFSRGLIGLQIGQPRLQQAQAAFLLVQLVSACSLFCRQLGNDLGRFFDFCLRLNNQIGPALLDRIDLPLQSNSYGVELARRDAEPGQKVAFEVIDCATRPHRRKETTLSAPVQFSISVQCRSLPSFKDGAGLVAEDGAITHEWRQALFAPGSWQNVCRTNGRTWKQ